MDYGKVTDILSVIFYDGVDLVGLDYLPDQYFIECQDQLVLSTYVSGGWVELTDEGKKQIDFAWRLLCEIRDLEADVMYDTPLDFFKAQAMDAEVIPISRGRKK